jgi:4-aminobutyrate aminotransferase-like enzyme
VVWERALGSNVWDPDGNRYVDLTAAFGVASCGHSHPELVRVASEQCARLMHGMGDVHPPTAKIELLTRLAAVAPGGLGHAVLGLNGADAVEAALKAAWLHTGRAGVIAFEGGYHGLLGLPLEAAGHARFKAPFLPLLAERTTVLPFPDPLRPPHGVSADAVLDFVLDAVASRLRAPQGPPIGAVIVEPIQGRGGVVVPPDGFLRGLRALCDGAGTVLIADEIFTGFGRTGEMFACTREQVVPDLLCVGKALSGGMPLSACLGTEEVMASWPTSTGEALHTSTFLGHPVACAVASAALDLHERARLPMRSERSGRRLRGRLERALSGVRTVAEVRGAGLMVGIDLTRDRGGAPAPELALQVMKRALAKGVILLPSGRAGNVLSLTPPLTITEPQLDHGADIVAECIREVSG